MRERPIIFSASMVNAIQSGRKTQTRRVVKAETHGCHVDCWSFHSDRGEWEMGETHQGPVASVGFVRCPYGVPGERLWVREALLVDGWYDGNEDRLPLVHVVDPAGDDRLILYRADYPDLRAIDDDGGTKYRKNGEEALVRWRPSIFMPRWASRITLEITEVRVQRVQEISEADAVAEGFRRSDGGHTEDIAWGAKGHFREGWDTINGKAGRRWADNPWTWAISFSVVK